MKYFNLDKLKSACLKRLSQNIQGLEAFDTLIPLELITHLSTRALHVDGTFWNVKLTRAHRMCRVASEGL